ncbi:hypothetical protein JHK87_024247 [Glycine soja]|nr:hypothetical protein JHK87_024247 [Glycine soja]
MGTLPPMETENGNIVFFFVVISVCLVNLEAILLRRGFEILEVFTKVPCQFLFSTLTVFANDPLFAFLLDRNDSEDQPPAKCLLSSVVIKVDDGELPKDVDAEHDWTTKDFAKEAVNGTIATVVHNDNNPFNSHQSGWFKRDNNQRNSKTFDIPTTEHVPRVLPKNEDPSLVNRNKRMLGQLLETLEKRWQDENENKEVQEEICKTNKHDLAIKKFGR